MTERRTVNWLCVPRRVKNSQFWNDLVDLVRNFGAEHHGHEDVAQEEFDVSIVSLDQCDGIGSALTGENGVVVLF